MPEIEDETDEPEQEVESVTDADYLEYGSFIADCDLDFSANTCEAIGNILITETPDASKKYSVSNLENIVSQKNRSSRIPHRLYGEIMYHARHAGLNDESFCLYGNMDREKFCQTLSAGISFLYNKGLLKRVSLNGFPDIYIPSGIGETLFVKDKLRRLINYSDSKKRPYEADFFLNSRGVKMVHILNKCLLRITSNIYTKKVSVSTGVSNAGANMYKIVHVPNEEIYCCSFLPLNAEDIVNTAKDFLETIEDHRDAVYIAASSERVYTDALCRLIIEKLGDAPYLKLYAYSYNEDLFFGCSGDAVDLKTEILCTVSDEFVSEAEETFGHDEQVEIKDFDEAEESISVINDDEKESISEDIVHLSDDSDEKEEDNDILNTDRNEEVFVSEDTVVSDMPRIQSDVPVKASAPVYKISYDTAKETAIELLLNNKVYCMLPYLKAASNENPNIEKLYLCVAYAFDDPMENVRYNSAEIISLLDSGLFLRDDFTIGLIYAAALRNFFSNHTADDYSVNQLKQIIDMPEMKNLAQEFINYKKHHRCGVEAVCDYSVREYIKINESLGKLSGEAAELYAQYVETPYTGGARVTRVKDTAEQIFDRNNFIAECLKYVKNDDVDSMSVAEEFVSQFMKSEKISEDNISSDKVGTYVDKVWQECGQNKVNNHSTKLVSGSRSKLISRVTKSVTAISHWVRLHKSQKSDVIHLSKNKKNELIELIDAVFDKCEKMSGKSKEAAAGMKCIIDTIEEIKDKLNGSYSADIRNRYYYIDFLKSDYVVLTEDIRGRFVPDLVNYCESISGFDICNRIIAHSENEKNFPTPAEFEMPDKCNLGSLRCLIKYNREINGEKVRNELFKGIPPYSNEKYEQLIQCLKHYESENVLNQINANIEREHKKFIERLELAQNYGKFDVAEDSDIKDTIQSRMDALFEATAKSDNKSENYGFYRFAIKKIEEHIEEQARKREPELQGRLQTLIDSLPQGDDSEEKKEMLSKISKIKGYISVCNFTAAEDYINRLSSDDIHDGKDDYLELADILNDFHNQYGTIYNRTFDTSIGLADKNDQVKSGIENYIKNRASARKDEKGGIALIQKWLRGSNDSPKKIEDLFSHLGLNVSVKPTDAGYSKRNYLKYYDCTLRDANENRTTYQHIVAPFGSQAYTCSFRAACLYGAFGKERILPEIREMSNYDKNTIIFVDYAYKENDRRELAKEIKKMQSNKVYMVVDRVIITYLASRYQRSTILSQLMTLSMPFSYYQPYVPDSGNSMPPEMFMGRDKELNEIKSDMGINMLYGGRQLGKTALLKKAASDVDGNDGAIAVYVDIKFRNEAKAAITVSRELMLKKVFSESDICDNWDKLAFNIKKNMLEKNISRLLLLIDEGDTFIDDSKNNGYQAIDHLKNLSSDGNIRFKFVIAGLHNLVRFDREGAMGNNSGIPHLKSLTIKPFRFSEAKELLERPLSTVGIFFKDDEKTNGLVSTILATTNYFPGLIQFYCSKVVESLCQRDCPCYDTQDAPPYYVTEAQIQKILADEKFTGEIKEKFKITLRLDTDWYYDVIALAVAWLFYENHTGSGYTADDVRTVGKDFGINKITDLSSERLLMFMDELVDLNIFRKDINGRYVFSRRNFIRLMGTYEEIFEMLMKYSS
ncbi:MAG: hypothetical protein HDT21_03110 [Ruminococcus sp.]|nr:hypothetical protein [Ruminococcus sp.]